MRMGNALGRILCQLTKMKKTFKYLNLMLSVLILIWAFSSCDLFKRNASEPNDSDGSDEMTVDTESLDNSGTADDKATMASIEATLMSFNIRTNNNPGEREDEIAALIVKYEASVVCMQEVQKEQADYLSQKLPDNYELVWNARDTANGEGSGIVYDSNIWSLMSRDCFWLSETPNVKSKGWGASYYRICVRALLKHNETGAKLNVFDVHLDHQVEAARNNGMKLILKKVADSIYPCFVAGDFNTSDAGAAYLYTAERLQDCRKKAPISDRGATFQNWGVNADHDMTKMIDFCFVSRDVVTPLEFKICRDKYGANNDQFISDHYAICTKVAIWYKE